MLKLYYNALSPYAQRALFFVHEAKISFTPVPLDFRAGDFSRADFKKDSPFNTVPAIELGGFTLSESGAILRYLAQRYQKTTWYPENLEARAQIDMVMDAGAHHVSRWIQQLGWHRIMAPRFGQTPSELKITEAETELMKWLPRFERHVAGRKWVMGPDLTLADAVVAPFLTMTPLLGISMADFGGTKALADRYAAMPTMQKIRADAEAFLAKR